ncbi:hypothetical protein SmJEL517_g05936 [Synchytrium microbalum]|uniref:RRM domain-containing protein n=1 Tax=Synchytrium microbalum TaxID=1806994 RepID=A0A507BL93_9FUNG|nr:uncharacterized protein SmJEL517_g05936 [Synchytrium microbalum]TPX30517.1 hypothetical protein SmJEL517_g05936 [Synchytrium microbalum]
MEAYEFRPEEEEEQRGASAPTSNDVPNTPNASIAQWVDELGVFIYTNDDGISYEYDQTKKAWYPRYDEKLVAEQQSIYGGNNDMIQSSLPSSTAENAQAAISNKSKKRKVYTMDEESKDANKKKKPDQPPKANTSIYVTGLPPNTDADEVKQVFSKYGIIAEDITTGQPRIKLYKDDSGVLKGDALITYFKPESVQLAINLMDDCEYRFGEVSKVHVAEAVFQPKERPPQEKKSGNQKASKVVAQKKLHQLKRKLDWTEDEIGAKSEKLRKVVVLKHMFTQQELEEDPTLILDLKAEVREECEKFGEVTNVIMFDKSDEGVLTVRFKEQEGADACVQKMNARFFAGRRVEAYLYDGKEKFAKSTGNETEEDQEERRKNYEQWLEAGGS